MVFTQRICVAVKVNDGEPKRQQDRQCMYSVTFGVCIQLHLWHVCITIVVVESNSMFS